MIARLYRIVKMTFDILRAAPGKSVIIQVQSENDEEHEIEYYQLPGFAGGPTPQDRATTVSMNGYRVAVASHNYRVNVEVEPGQTRVYSTPADGSAVMAEVDMLPDGQLTAQNDAGAKAVLHTDGLIEAANDSQSLKALVDSLVDELVAFRTFGSPTQHATDPGTVTNLQSIKSQFGQLLK